MESTTERTMKSNTENTTERTIESILKNTMESTTGTTSETSLCLDFRAKCAHAFLAPFVYLNSFSNLLFSYFFPELSVFSVTKMKSDIVYGRAQSTILQT